MLRLASVPLSAAVATAALASGCLGPADYEGDCELGPSEAELHRLEERYALGSRATIDLYGEAPLALESSNPAVVRVESVVNGAATLSFVGAGQATLVLENDISTAEQVVEVVRHDAFVVVLSEFVPIPIGTLSNQVILAGHQHFIVLYLDSRGERLWGDGLAEIGLSDRLELCDHRLGSLEFHCLNIREPGLHVLEVRVGEERLVLPFVAVLERDIVDVALLQPDEEELLPGTWVQVDVVGVTEEGMHVAGIHPRFEVDDDWYAGYFAYQYDPAVRPQGLRIEALDRRIGTSFRGVPSEQTALGCGASGKGGQGPIPAMASLLGLVLFTNKRNRSAW
jgi:hypothetical protein